jgi:hypothetical protein
MGQRVVFQPTGGSVKLAGRVVAIDEKTITLVSGSKKIPVYKDKGIFVPERNPITVVLPEKGGAEYSFER